jgi:FtsH-binding integral membrane protein
VDSETDPGPEHGPLWNRFSQAVGLIVGLLVGYAVGGDTSSLGSFVTLVVVGVPVAIVANLSLDWLRNSATQ